MARMSTTAMPSVVVIRMVESSRNSNAQHKLSILPYFLERCIWSDSHFATVAILAAAI
jgi:hypothetical protein